jgi:hypothetical protein
MHIKLRKVFQDESIVRYEITTPDFSDQFEGVKFGIIEIDLKSGAYIHKDNSLWEKNKILPIAFYETPVEERKILYATKFKGYFSGMYALSIYDFIKKSIGTNNYPDEKWLIR